MGTLYKTIPEFYNYVNDDLADSRTKSMFLVGSPLPVIAILYLYHSFVKKWGPALMKNREPFELKKLIIVYNAVQIYLSAYLAYVCVTVVYLPGHYNLWCEKLTTEATPLENQVVYYVWMYYMVKLIDLVDTVFFVLRKKFTHVSFLHVYHHMGMSLLGYVGTKYVPGGHGIFLGFINSLVHAVMYTYYLISVVRPQWVRKWWKKYITQLQILQFLILILHFGHVLFEPSCEYPKWVSMLFVPQNIFILYLFIDFYIKEYIYKKDKET